MKKREMDSSWDTTTWYPWGWKATNSGGPKMVVISNPASTSSFVGK